MKLRYHDVAILVEQHGQTLRQCSLPKQLRYTSETSKLLLMIFWHCKQLQTFTEFPCYGLPHPEDFKLLASLTRLQALSLCGNVTDAAMLLIFDQCRRLDTLHLCQCPGLTDDTIQAMSMVTGLKVLALQDLEQITSSGIKHLSKLANLKKLVLTVRSLESLQGFGVAVRDGLEEAFQGQLPITHLYLSSLELLTDEAFRHVAVKLKELRHFYMDCNVVSDAGLKHLADSSKHLKSLSIRCRTSTFTLEGVVYILEQSQSLKKLEFDPMYDKWKSLLRQAFPEIHLRSELCRNAFF